MTRGYNGITEADMPNKEFTKQFKWRYCHLSLGDWDEHDCWLGLRRPFWKQHRQGDVTGWSTHLWIYSMYAYVPHSKLCYVFPVCRGLSSVHFHGDIYIYTDMKGHKLRNVYIVPWKSDVAELLATGSKWTEKWVASRTTDFLLEWYKSKQMNQRSTSVYGPWFQQRYQNPNHQSKSSIAMPRGALVKASEPSGLIEPVNEEIIIPEINDFTMILPWFYTIEMPMSFEDFPVFSMFDDTSILTLDPKSPARPLASQAPAGYSALAAQVWLLWLGVTDHCCDWNRHSSSH